MIIYGLHTIKHEPQGPYFHRDISQEFFFALFWFVCLFLASREMEKAHKRNMSVPIRLSVIPGIYFWWGLGEGLEVDGAKQERDERLVIQLGD